MSHYATGGSHIKIIHNQCMEFVFFGSHFEFCRPLVQDLGLRILQSHSYLLFYLESDRIFQDFSECLRPVPRPLINNIIFVTIFDLILRSTFSKTDAFGTSTKCPSKRDVRLIESQIKGVKKGRDQL